ncbi:MAG TPA: biopolymer transporter ExbD [Methylocella sp.]|nr:biopolymer transporter ExbD [Methylocella sp.]
MAFSTSGRPSGLYRPLADINVTPMVDVMLVLLVIFMVTAPMLASGLKVDLPQAKQAKPLDPKDPVVIAVTKDGSLSLGSETVEKDKLIEAIMAKIGGDLTHTIHLRGDKEAAYGQIVAVMDLLAANGLTHLAIVADAREKKEAPSPKSEEKEVPPPGAPPL